MNQRLSKLMYTEEGATEVSRAFFLVAEASSKSLMKEVGFRETISSVMKVMKCRYVSDVVKMTTLLLCGDDARYVDVES